MDGLLVVLWLWLYVALLVVSRVILTSRWELLFSPEIDYLELGLVVGRQMWNEPFGRQVVHSLVHSCVGFVNVVVVSECAIVGYTIVSRARYQSQNHPKQCTSLASQFPSLEGPLA